jgi:hypothetical protein
MWGLWDMNALNIGLSPINEAWAYTFELGRWQRIEIRVTYQVCWD